MKTTPPCLSHRLIIALDMMSPVQALALAQTLCGLGVTFKVGMELFYRGGMALAREIAALQARPRGVFIDLKLHDIPNTAGMAAQALASQGVDFFNVHALGGEAMMRAAVEGARHGHQIRAAVEGARHGHQIRAAVEGARQGRQMRAAAESARQVDQTRPATDPAQDNAPPLLLGVTLLTSLDAQTLARDLKIDLALESMVVHLAQLAQRAGLGGVVCSAQEAASLRAACGADFQLVTPGIRPAFEARVDDQARICTPAQALRNGADYLVVGRPVTQAADPAHSVARILEEMAAA